MVGEACFDATAAFPIATSVCHENNPPQPDASLRHRTIANLSSLPSLHCKPHAAFNSAGFCESFGERVRPEPAQGPTCDGRYPVYGCTIRAEHLVPFLVQDDSEANMTQAANARGGGPKTCKRKQRYGCIQASVHTWAEVTFQRRKGDLTIVRFFPKNRNSTGTGQQPFQTRHGTRGSPLCWPGGWMGIKAN